MPERTVTEIPKVLLCTYILAIVRSGTGTLDCISQFDRIIRLNLKRIRLTANDLNDILFRITAVLIN
jgi:hypothetical protein